jgi:hypothetical protein
MGLKLMLLNKSLQIAQGSYDKAVLANKNDLAAKLLVEINQIQEKIKRIEDKEK